MYKGGRTTLAPTASAPTTSGHVFDDDELADVKPNPRVAPNAVSSRVTEQLASLVKKKSAVPSGRGQRALTQKELEELSEQRERLVETIMIEEENIMGSHKQFIDGIISCIKEDSEAFQNLQHDSRMEITLDLAFDEYTDALVELIDKKEKMISKLKTRIEYYNKKCKEEEVLRGKIESHENQNDSFGEVFDLKQAKGNDFGLLDD